MYSVSPQFTTATSSARTPQLHVRKLRLEAHEAEGWETSLRSGLMVRARRRFWAFAGLVVAGSGLLTWAAWELIR